MLNLLLTWYSYTRSATPYTMYLKCLLLTAICGLSSTAYVNWTVNQAISGDLADLLDLDSTRCYNGKDVEEMLYQYIKDNKLISRDGRVVRPDSRMNKLFGSMEKGSAQIFKIFTNNLKNECRAARPRSFLG
eukprot:GFUD01047511.1.p1 GENE.GFUD01047511.1~~GFUD01047511.1.p1  ORF type:complete len:132 (+),score=21.28 GFUD01047511.1:322-717(+)